MFLEGMNEGNRVGLFYGISEGCVKVNAEGCVDGELDGFDEEVSEG